MSLYDKNLSREKRASLEFAEDAREQKWDHPSFVLQLFHGRLDWPLIHPFPKQSPEDKAEGDRYIAELKAFLKKNLDPEQVDRDSEIPEAVMRGLAERKAFAMKVPKAYGGLGLSQLNYGRVMAMISSYCGSTAVLLSAHQSIGVPQPLKLFGTEPQKRKYLPRFAEGQVSAFALTEVEAGSDPRNMSTTAVPEADGNFYILNGEKLWCTNGLIADVVVVMAVTPPKMVKGKEKKQISAFIVEMDSPGIERVHRCHFMGLHGIQNGVIRFRNVRVPKENLILKEGDGLKLALTTLNTGRLTLPVGSAGVSKWALGVVRKWAGKREQWGAPVGEHESVAMKIGMIASHTFAIEAMGLLTSHMADRQNSDIRLEAAIAKYFCTEWSYRIVDEALQIRGGQGYENSASLRARGMDYWPIERVLRDIRINLIIEGTSDIMHLFIAREVLDPYLDKAKVLLGKGRLIGKIGILAGMGCGYAGQWLPARSVPPDLDPKLHAHARFIQASSQRLGRHIVHLMARHQKKLATRQALINRMVDIGTDLFAMTCAISYADYLRKETGAVNALELADLFCRDARRRISHQWSDQKKQHDRVQLSVAAGVLKKDYEWLEQGIIS